MKLAKIVKNLRPAYAVKLGDGKFVGAQPTYQCSKCGAVAYTSNRPGSWDFGGCGGDKNKAHNWIKC